MKHSLYCKNFSTSLNVVDNRVKFVLRNVTSEDIGEIYDFMVTNGGLLRRGFTSLTDATHFQPADKHVIDGIKAVQGWLDDNGRAKAVRAVDSGDTNFRNHGIMSNGIYNNVEAANNFLNTWRRENGWS